MAKLKLKTILFDFQSLTSLLFSANDVTIELNNIHTDTNKDIKTDKLYIDRH